MRGRGKSDRIRIPRPNPDVEKQSTGSGPVITYKLSEEELNKLREKDGPGNGLTRAVFLEGIASGETISSIERAYGMKNQTLTYWVGKWNLRGITPDRARELLAAPHPPSEQALPQSPTEDMKDAEIKHYRSEIERLRALCDEFSKSNVQLKKEIQDWTETDLQRAMEIQQLNQALAELTDERALLLQTIEKAATSAVVGSDAVNHPTHYNAGAVECIDAIEAATTGLTGGQAYNTGAAIKYLWRWSRKGGAEDLRKARWYIDRLLERVASE